MNCKEIIDNVLSREGLYRVIADPFATTDLIVQENIRILNQLVKALVLKNSLSDLLRECKFRTYQEFSAGTELVVNQAKVQMTFNGNVWAIGTNIRLQIWRTTSRP